MSELLAAADPLRPAPPGAGGGGLFRRGGLHRPGPLASGRVEPSRLVLAHVNHCLRGEASQRDEEAARQFARRFGLAFQVHREDVAALARERGQGVEECGRQVRYRFFQSLAPGEEDRILTAHNAGDNAETVLLHLCRGTSLPGLLGIPYARGKVLRPLLRVPREEIEAYCREQGLSYVTDESNFSLEYARNRMRLQVVPAPAPAEPRLPGGGLPDDGDLSQDCEYLEGEARALLERCRGPWGLEAAPLAQAHRPFPAGLCGCGVRGRAVPPWKRSM